MKLEFTPHPEYWITFGNFEKGEVLDSGEITNKQKINFKHNQYEIIVTLQADNTWKIVLNHYFYNKLGRKMKF